MSRKVASYIAWGIVLVIVILDVLLWQDMVPRNTFSELIVDVSADHPAIPLLGGFIVGHWWPVTRRYSGKKKG